MNWIINNLEIIFVIEIIGCSHKKKKNHDPCIINQEKQRKRKILGKNQKQLKERKD